MQGFIISHLWALIAGPVVGVVVYFVHEGLQEGYDLFCKQSPIVKRIITCGMSLILTPLATILGAQVPAECTNIAGNIDTAACFAALGDKGWLTAVIGAAVAFLTHHLAKTNQPPTPPSNSTLASK